MNADMLLKHFERISEAPDAVTRLRRFILDLAVRGKLVEQDPNDEPAGELLKRIQAEKARLMKEKQAKKEKPLAQIDEVETSFSVPASWEWARLQAITSYIQRGKSPIYAIDDGFPVVSQKCVQWRGFDLSAARLITKESIKKYEEVRFLRENDLLWNSTGTGTIGRVVRIASPPKNLVCDSHVAVVRCALVNAEYVRLWLCSDHVYQLIEGRASGATNQVELTSQMATSQVVPLPPLAEQHRIVAKVDELMALCDQLEAAQSEREARRDHLVAASLHRIATAPASAGEAETGSDMVIPLPEAARFHLAHLPRLATRPEHIKQLRQTILNLAVRGRLVPQYPNDEPAAELLQRIGAKTSDDAPFSIPNSWSWISVAQIGKARLGKMLDKAKNKGTPRRYLRNVNLRWFDFDLSNVYEMPFEDGELDEFALLRGDVLICEGGEPGRAAVWDEREKSIYFQKAIHRVRFAEGVMSHFFVNILRESADSGRLFHYFTGVGIKHFTGKGLSSFIFPLPPLAEQHRIVAKVDELMALCDQLEAQLTTTQTDSRRLLEAVLRDALAPAMEEAAL